MIVTVQLFASIKDEVGHSSIDIELTEPATVADLRNSIAKAYPSTGPIVSRSAFALDNQFVGDDKTINENNEVACIPPVSGG